MSDFCRFCACKLINKDLISMDQLKIELIDKFARWLNSSIENDDILPWKLCEMCYNTIVQFEKFANNFLDAQSQLRSISSIIFSDNVKTEEEDDNYMFEESQQIPLRIKEGSDDSFEYEFIISEESKQNCMSDDDSSTQYALVESSSAATQSDSSDYEKLNEFCAMIKQKSDDEFETEILTAKGTKRKKKIRKVCQKLRCNECSEIKYGASQLEGHCRAVHGKKAIYKCWVCFKIFENYRSFAAHIVIHGDRPKFNCEFCSCVFARKVNLRYHIESNHIDKSTVTENTVRKSSYKIRKCPECGKEIKNSANFYKHLQIHFGKGTSCDTCCIDLSTVANLKEHLASVHSMEPKEVCDICQHKFWTKATLYYHKATRHIDTSKTEDKIEV